jgi:hypothetical protein
MSSFLGPENSGGGGSPSMLTGDITVSGNNVTVTKIQGNPVATGTPTNGQVLTWISTANSFQYVTPSSSGSAAVDGYFNCASSIAVGDVVNIASTDTVVLASATSASLYASGIVSQKITSTFCLVQFEGELSAFSGLTPGFLYYLSLSAGNITDTSPTASGQISQKIGTAKDASTLVIEIDTDFVQL